MGTLSDCRSGPDFILYPDFSITVPWSKTRPAIALLRRRTSREEWEESCRITEMDLERLRAMPTEEEECDDRPFTRGEWEVLFGAYVDVEEQAEIIKQHFLRALRDWKRRAKELQGVRTDDERHAFFAAARVAGARWSELAKKYPGELGTNDPASLARKTVQNFSSRIGLILP